MAYRSSTQEKRNTADAFRSRAGVASPKNNETSSRSSQRDRLDNEDKDRRKDNENDIRNDVMRSLQSQFNATRDVFGQLKERQIVDQQGRVGQNVALMAGRGLSASKRGTAIGEGVAQYGRDIQADTATKEASAIAGVQMQAENEIQRRLGNQVTRDQELAVEANQAEIAEFLNSGVTSAEEIFKAANGRIPFDEILGVTQGIAGSAGATAQDGFTLSKGQSRYELNPQTGKYERVAAGTGATSGSGGGSGSGFSSGAAQGALEMASGYERKGDMQMILSRMGGTKMSDREADRITELAEAGFKIGKDVFEIIDHVTGFKVTEDALNNNQSLTSNIRSIFGSADLDGAQVTEIARSLNKGNNTQAVRILENAIYAKARKENPRAYIHDAKVRTIAQKVERAKEDTELLGWI